MKCLTNTVKHCIISLLLHRYVRYCHINGLICEWNVALRNYDLTFGLK